MIKKEITLNNGKTYLVGFKEIGSQKDGIECHVFEKGFIFDKSIYYQLFIKGLLLDYKSIAISTILDFERECEQKSKLINEKWA